MNYLSEYDSNIWLLQVDFAKSYDERHMVFGLTVKYAGLNYNPVILY